MEPLDRADGSHPPALFLTVPHTGPYGTNIKISAPKIRRASYLSAHKSVGLHATTSILLSFTIVHSPLGRAIKDAAFGTMD